MCGVRVAQDSEHSLTLLHSTLCDAHACCTQDARCSTVSMTTPSLLHRTWLEHSITVGQLASMENLPAVVWARGPWGSRAPTAAHCNVQVYVSTCVAAPVCVDADESARILSHVVMCVCVRACACECSSVSPYVCASI